MSGSSNTRPRDPSLTMAGNMEVELDKGGKLDTCKKGSWTGAAPMDEMNLKHQSRKFNLILETNTSDELSEDFTNIFQTVAVVAALFLSMCFSAEGITLEADPDSIWGSNTDVGIQLYLLLNGIETMMMIFLILICVSYCFQFAHIAKESTKEFLAELGMLYVQLPAAIIQWNVGLYLTTLEIQFSLQWKPWAFWCNLPCLALMMLGYTYINLNIIAKKMKVLERSKVVQTYASSTQEEHNSSDAK